MQSLRTPRLLARLLIGLVTVLLGNVMAQAVEPGSLGTWDPRTFGAKADGKSVDTQPIQAAIDACAAAGGGQVCFHGGTFLTGTLYLKDNVSLYLQSGATLLGSVDLDDYPVVGPAYYATTDPFELRCLIFAEGAKNIALLGQGTIDGQGAAFTNDKPRPYIIRFNRCQGVTVRGITLRNSPRWVQRYFQCENVVIDGITVNSKANRNNDGIDIDSCQKVRVANCWIHAIDDAIVLKSWSDRPCKMVTVTNCVVSSDANGLKLGTESNGGFEDILFSNCVVYDTRGAGISLNTADGGRCERVNVSNITMVNAAGGINVRLGNRAKPYAKGAPTPGIGAMKDIIISNVQAVGANEVGCSIAGLPDHPIENITLENIRITFTGGGTAQHVTREIPERPESYPSQRTFGVLPAYGFWCRHARNVRFHHVDVQFATDDVRPAFVLDDVQDAELVDCRGQSTDATPWLVWLKQCEGVSLQGWRMPEPLQVFLRADGGLSKNILLIGNDFAKVQQVVDRGPDITDEAISLIHNRTKGPAVQ